VRIRSVGFTMLRSTGKFENDRAEVVVDLDSDSEFEVALEIAKARCEQALGLKKNERLAARERGVVRVDRW